MIEQVCIGADDLFYDLGSGLGQVPILVHLLTGASCRGIEFEPAYCAYARRVATRLKLPRVRFLINADLRATDYADGLSSSSTRHARGQMLQNVLNKLAADTRGHNVAICTYGPCTAVVTHLPWLQRADDGTRYPTLGIFRRA